MTFAVGDLSPGESKELKFNAAAAGPGNCVNSAEVTTDQHVGAKASAATHWHFYKFTRDAIAGRLHRYNSGKPATPSRKSKCNCGLLLRFRPFTLFIRCIGLGLVTRFLPNQWDLFTRLRNIPDSVEEFTGFYRHLDPIGGDFLGFSPANCNRGNGRAVVRNVCLPVGYKHVTVPNTRHLLRSQQIMDWINDYTPPAQPKCEVQFDTDSGNILWTADVWYNVKKHWVLELQCLVRAQRAGSPQP